MSVFFNFQIEGNREEAIKAESNISMSSGTIIDQQDAYQVGVTRFKVPISNVPLFRIYPYEYQIGLGFKGALNWRGPGATPQLGGISLNTSEVFGGRSITTTSGKYGIDVLEGSKAYIDINSQEE